MSSESHTPAAPASAVSATAEPAVPSPPVFDAHGFDPNEFEWRPVPRRPRADGWKPDVQRAFIEALADTGMVDAAAREVDMSVASCYRLRRAPGAENFARAWDAAIAFASQRLVDVAFERAIQGVDQPIFDRDGCRIGARQVYSDRLLMFLLRAYQPARFRPLREAWEARDDAAQARPAGAGEAAAPAALPIEQAIAALTPVVPADPHLLMAPEKLDREIDTARALAEVDELYPIDDREKYVFPRKTEDHPATHARRRKRMQAEIDREARAADRKARVEFGFLASLSPHLPR